MSAPPSNNTNLTGFEGPEKRLEIDFHIDTTNDVGMRVYKESEWQEMLNHANCTIISVTSNEYLDAYVLSESSLFVYPYKVMIKTCGTTTLLGIVPALLAMAQRVGTLAEHVSYSRKNLKFPSAQLGPHVSFERETAVLNEHFDGHSYTLGPVTGDHWYLYVADHPAPSESRLTPPRHEHTPDQMLEIMMSDLDPEVMRQFWKKNTHPDTPGAEAVALTQSSGIAGLVPGAVNDPLLFEPCGYSLNGLLGDAFYTIHITPEDHCSFVSFETNWVPADGYTRLIQNVFDVFRPRSACVCVFSDLTSVAPSPMTSFDLTAFKLLRQYRAVSYLQFETCHAAFYSLTAKPVTAPGPVRSPSLPLLPEALTTGLVPAEARAIVLPPLAALDGLAPFRSSMSNPSLIGATVDAIS